MGTSIRVEDDTHAMLATLKRDDETFDELLFRLVQERRASILNGAGLWNDSDAAERAREARKEMKQGLSTR